MSDILWNKFIPCKAHCPSSDHCSFISTWLIQDPSWCYTLNLTVCVSCMLYLPVCPMALMCTGTTVRLPLYFPLISMSHWVLFIRITFIFYNYWYVGMLHNRVYTIFASFPHSLFPSWYESCVLPFSSIWKFWICLVLEGWTECEFPVLCVTSRVHVLLKMLSDCYELCMFWMNAVWCHNYVDWCVCLWQWHTSSLVCRLVSLFMSM